MMSDTDVCQPRFDAVSCSHGALMMSVSCCQGVLKMSDTNVPSAVDRECR